MRSIQSCGRCRNGWVKDPTWGESQWESYLVECECGALSRERVERFFRDAKAPPRFAEYTLGTFPVTARTAAALGIVRHFAERQTERKSLYLWGPYGAGKTCAALCVARVVCEQTGWPWLFVTVPDLLDRIRQTYSPSSVDRADDLIATVREVPLLVLDDMGAERVTEWVQEKLFQLVNHRHDFLRDTIFTSNLSLNGMRAHVGERTVERLEEMCEVVHLDGPNLRGGN